MSEKEAIIINTWGNEGTHRSNKLKYLRIGFATLLLLGIAMYTCCTTLQPTSLSSNQSHTRLSHIGKAVIIDAKLINAMQEADQVQDSNAKQREEQDTANFQNHVVETPTTTADFSKRDDSSSSSSDSDSDSSETSNLKSTPIYDKPWMRFLFALGGIIVLNMIAICIHHLYLIVTRSQNRYRAFEEEKSPF